MSIKTSLYNPKGGIFWGEGVRNTQKAKTTLQLLTHTFLNYKIITIFSNILITKSPNICNICFGFS